MLLFFSSSAASRPQWVDWVHVVIRCLLKMVPLYGLMAQQNWEYQCVMFKDRRFVGHIINHIIYSRFPVKNVAQSRGAKEWKKRIAPLVGLLSRPLGLDPFQALQQNCPSLYKQFQSTIAKLLDPVLDIPHFGFFMCFGNPISHESSGCPLKLDCFDPSSSTIELDS